MAISERELGEGAPASTDPTDEDKGTATSEELTGVHRDRALACVEHEWEFSRAAKADRGEFLGTLVGHFAVFNRWTEINSPLEGHFMERLAHGAFTKTFAENQRNMRVLLNHGKDPSVGLKPLGPIRRLEQDETGAYYEVALLDTSYNRDLIPGLKAGQYGASFRFSVVREKLAQFPERSEANPKGIPETTIVEAKVREFGPVTFGAYEEATAGLRSLNDELIGMDLRMMAASDPTTLASFARLLTGGLVSADVGTKRGQQEEETERTEEHDEQEERVASETTSASAESTPADRAPDRTRKPFGSTLKKRAVPLTTKRQTEDPIWKL